MNFFKRLFVKRVPMPEMFYCHQHGKAMFTIPYRQMCIDELHETELYRSDELKLLKNEKYYEEVEKEAYEEGRMSL